MKFIFKCSFKSDHPGLDPVADCRPGPDPGADCRLEINAASYSKPIADCHPGPDPGAYCGF